MPKRNMTQPSTPTESSDSTIIYTYYRNGVALNTPSIDLAFERNDGVFDVTFVEIHTGDVESS